MVSKITIFECYFDGAQFGPAAIAGRDAVAEPAPTAESTPLASRANRPSVPRLVLLVGGLAAAVLVSRWCIGHVENADRGAATVGDEPLAEVVEV